MSKVLSKEEYFKQASQSLIISNWIELVADLDSPISIYAKLSEKSKDVFLFESVQGNENIARYSFIGFRSLEKLEVLNGIDPYDLLQKKISNYKDSCLELPFFHKGFVGYFSFESVRFIEPSLKKFIKENKSLDAYFLLVGSMVVFDHVQQKIYLISNQKKLTGSDSELDELYLKSLDEIEEMKELIFQESKLKRLDFNLNQEAKKNDYKSNIGERNFKDMVRKAKEHILEGDIFQVVLSHKFRKDLSLDPIKAYRVLRIINPSPYLFLFNINASSGLHFSLVGSSPELLVKAKNHNSEGYRAEIRPIAGTYKRSHNHEEDLALMKKLLEDEKERAEHVMLVDLARNDLGKLCKKGSIRVAESMIIEKYSHVLHIVSSVLGDLSENYGAENSIELLKATFPAGTLSGAPKIEAMSIIAQLEEERRESYGGTIGNFSLDGSMDTAILIRTIVIEKDKITLQSGAGIVADSSEENEFQETYNKASALMKVVDIASDCSV